MPKLNNRVNFYLYGMQNAPSCALIINDSNGGNNGKIQGKIHGNYTQKLPTKISWAFVQKGLLTKHVFFVIFVSFYYHKI